MDERLIFFTAVVFIGILAQWIAWRLKLPSILLLLAFGFVGGQFYDQSAIVNSETLFAVVSLAVGVILLEGGLSLRFSELKEAGPSVLRLVGLGSIITWVISSVAAHYVIDFSWPVAILFSAILVVTGPTVIGPILRTVKPQRSVNSILKWEGIVIDPVGAVLAVLVFGVFFHEGHGHSGFVGVITGLGKTILVGVGLGFGAAAGLSYVISKHWVPDFLQSLVVLSVSLALFTFSNLIQHEAGLLTATVIGIGLANQHRAKIRHVIEFKEVLRTILISCLFIILGARISIQDILSVWREALLFLIILIVIVRPASVFLANIGSKRLSFREKMFLSLMAPRGIVAAAVSSVFALDLIEFAEPGSAVEAEAQRIVPITYTVIVGTVAFYGLLSGFFARKLGVAMKNPQGVLFIGIRRWTIEAAQIIKDAGFRVLMVDSNYRAARDARMAGIPTMNVNVLSDFTSEETDLVGIGYVVATTQNDQVNTLACMSFGHHMGNSNVFQLKPVDFDESERKAATTHYNGRLLGRDPLAASAIAEMERKGAIVKVNTLSDNFTFDDFEKQYGEDALILFVITPSNELVPQTPESSQLTKGDKIISLVFEKKEEPRDLLTVGNDDDPDVVLP